MKKKNKMPEIVQIVFVGYMLLLMFMYLMQRSFMYYPDTALVAPKEAGVPEMEVVTVNTMDDIPLVAWYKKAEKNKPTIIYFHGNAGNIAGVAYKAKMLFEAGYGVLLLEYRGYGGNRGDIDEKGLIKDAVAARDFLVMHKAQKIAYYGESLGSGVAVAVAESNTDPYAMILEAPFSSAVDVAKRTYWFLPVSILMRDKFNSVDRIKKVNTNLLILHGERDGTVPVELGKKLFEVANEPKHIELFPLGHHADLYDHGAGKVVLDWLESLENKE